MYVCMYVCISIDNTYVIILKGTSIVSKINKRQKTKYKNIDTINKRLLDIPVFIFGPFS